MGEQGQTPSGQRFTQFWLFQQAVDAESHADRGYPSDSGASSRNAKASA